MNWIQFFILIIVIVLSVLFITGAMIWVNACKFENIKTLIDHYFQRKEQHYNELIKAGLDIAKYN